MLLLCARSRRIHGSNQSCKNGIEGMSVRGPFNKCLQAPINLYEPLWTPTNLFKWPLNGFEQTLKVDALLKRLWALIMTSNPWVQSLFQTPSDFKHLLELWTIDQMFLELDQDFEQLWTSLKKHDDFVILWMWLWATLLSCIFPISTWCGHPWWQTATSLALTLTHFHPCLRLHGDNIILQHCTVLVV